MLTDESYRSLMRYREPLSEAEKYHELRVLPLKLVSTDGGHHDESHRVRLEN